MRKYLFSILIIIFSLTFTGCNNSEIKDNKSNINEKSVSVETTTQTQNNSEISSSKLEKADVVSHSTTKTETTLEFDEIPNRIAVGTVSLAEIFNELEIDLVGVPSVTSFPLPEKYKDLPSIGMSMSPDAEILASLKLDAFITDAALKDSLNENLTNKKIPAYFIGTSGYDEIISSIISLGDAFNKNKQAEKIIKEIKDNEKKALDKVKDKSPQKVMIVFGTPKGFMLATDNSFVGDLVNRLNSKNVTSSLETHSPFIPFSQETVLEMNPDVILRLTHADPTTSKKMFDKEFAENKIWQAMSAVQNDRVYDLDPNYFSVVANIKCAEALNLLADMLYEVK